jgi:hypothetical protein
MMTVSYRNTPTELLWLQLYYLPRSRLLQVVMLLFLAIMAYRASSVFSIPNASLAARIITFVAFMGQQILLWLLSMGVLFGLVYAMSYFRSSKKPPTGSKISASETCLTIESSASRSEYQWSGVHKVVRNSRFILLYVTEVLAYAIPKRAFTSTAEAESFYTFVEQPWKQSRSTT